MGYNDTRQQPITMKVGPNGTGSIIDYTYEYYDNASGGKNNNRIRKITDGVDSAYTVNYSYDQWNRLTQATAPAYGRGYVYDAWGNLRGAGGGPYGGYVLNYGTNANTAPATNRILSVTENGQTQPFSYDNAGNLTAGDGMSYAYDAANRMVSVNGGALGQYGYDGEGMRVKKTESGVTVWYVRSSKLGNTAFEVTSVGVQRAYVYGGNGKLVAEQASDGQFYWLHTNHLGSARVLTDVSGGLAYRGHFDPHGQVLSEWSSSGNPNLNAKKFTGHERDVATGLDYAEARTYNAGRGRFVQPDPIGIRAASKSKPESLNRYNYVRNDPINLVDPKGTCIYYWVQLNERYGYWDSTLCNPDLPEIERPDLPPESGGGTTQDTRTDCQRFSDMVQEIANRSQNAEGFMNEMARTFTAANDSTIAEMSNTYANALPAGRPTFGDSGFDPRYQDGSNQARHFVGGLIAGYRLGEGPGMLLMDAREGGPNADTRLNGVSVTMGANEIIPRDPVSFTFFPPVGKPTQITLPGSEGYRGLSDKIRQKVCPPQR